MSEEEYMECSVVAYPRQIKFLHINGGAISYYVDRHVSDYVDRLQQENQELKKQLLDASIQIQELTEQDMWCPSNCEKLEKLQQENKQLKDKLSKIETLIINHNCDTGDIYYKYNSRFLKSELKKRILEIVYEVSE